MTHAMRRIAGELGLSTDDAQLLRLTNNAVFALPRSGVVVRITRSHKLYARVEKVVALGRWFADVDAPTIRLAEEFEQPARDGDLLATIWRFIPPIPPAPTVADLGHVLRTFHPLGPPPFSLPAWDPVGDARSRLEDAEGLGKADKDFLLHWCEDLERRVDRLRARDEPRLVHGDAHAGNLLRTPDGRVVLCDFDPTSLGPWQADLAAVAVGENRFGTSGRHSTLASAYGYDVTTDPDWQTFREARELKMVVAAVPLLTSGPGVAEEFALRLRSIRDDSPQLRWTPFAKLRAKP